MDKPIVLIYVQPKAKSTEVLTNFIGKHIDQINENLMVKLIKVTAKNVQIIKAKGIERTPTLVYEKKKYVSLEKIMKMLTPPAENKDHFGYGNTSPDDLVHSFHDAIISTGDDDEPDDDSPEMRGQVIRQKMAAMQKRRPEMQGVESNKKIKGGRKVKSGTPGKTKFESDADFVKASRTDNMELTPFKTYMDDADGDLILEEYFLDEANRSGKKVGKVVSKRR
jgi:hypothetical protein